MYIYPWHPPPKKNQRQKQKSNLQLFLFRQERHFLFRKCILPTLCNVNWFYIYAHNLYIKKIMFENFAAAEGISVLQTHILLLDVIR